MCVKWCRHCRQVHATEPRGLCLTCFCEPGVKERYPVGQYSPTREGHGTVNRAARAPVPTLALPGTAEKIAVLEGRAERGESLFHQADGYVED